jgi:AcrR family transcriptional regulator
VAQTVSTRATRRGRPPKTSLEEIVDKAVELMAREPGKDLSLHAIAKAIGITPMAIYRYANDRDELMEAVADRMLRDFKPDIPEQPWQSQIRHWAFATRDYFLANPALFTIIGWQQHIASAWLAQIATLARILAQTGRRDDRLADTVQWVSTTVMSAILMEIASKRSGSRVSMSDVDKLSAEDAELVGSLMRHLLKKNARTVFTECVENMVLTIEVSQ